MEKDHLIHQTLVLLEHNSKAGKWDNWLDDKHTYEYVKLLSKEDSFRSIFDFEEVADKLIDIFNDLELSKKKILTISDAEDVIKLLRGNLEINIKDYFIAIPLINATLNNNIEIDGKVFFLAGTQEEKTSYLKDVLGLTYEEMAYQCEHTVNSRSPNFFDDPLMVVKYTHLYRHVTNTADYLIYSIVNIIHVLFWALIYPENQNPRFRIFRDGKRKESIYRNQHLAIYSNSGNWGHLPLQFSYETDYNLDWFNETANKDKFLELLRLLEQREHNYGDLAGMFLRAMSFFSKGINVPRGNRYFDTELDTILYLNIASEILFVRGNEPKTPKIVNSLANLADLPNVSKTKRKDIARKMCKVRGKFVHSGESYYHEDDQELQLFKRMVAKVLSHSFIYVSESEKVALEKNSTPIDLWFGKLEK